MHIVKPNESIHHLHRDVVVVIHSEASTHSTTLETISRSSERRAN